MKKIDIDGHYSTVQHCFHHFFFIVNATYMSYIRIRVVFVRARVRVSTYTRSALTDEGRAHRSIRRCAPVCADNRSRCISQADCCRENGSVRGNFSLRRQPREPSVIRVEPAVEAVSLG